MAASSRIVCHVTDVTLPQTGFLNMEMRLLYSAASTVIRSQFSRASLRCCRTPNAHHGWMRSQQIFNSIFKCNAISMHQNLWAVFPELYWIYATKNRGSSEGKIGSSPVLARCTKRSGRKWVQYQHFHIFYRVNILADSYFCFLSYPS